MKEILLTPERKKKGAPIHIIFGQHNDKESSIAGLKHLDRVVGDYLQNTTSGNIVLFQEDIIMPAPQARLVEKFVEGGQSPSESYVNIKFWERHQRFPDRARREDSIEVFRIEKTISKFSQEGLRIADEHFSTSKKRIRVLWEQRPVKEILQEIIWGKKVDVYIAAKNRSFLNVEKGNFKKGLKAFKKGVRAFAKYLSRREDRLAQKISAAAENTDVVAIVGHIGSIHTRLGHILVKKGYEVNRTFPQMENGRYLWGTGDQALRHKLVSPNYDPSELEWYRWTIGNSMQEIYTIIPPIDGITGKAMSQQEIIRKTIAEINKFKDIESITQLEKDIRQNGGLIKAILSQKIFAS